MPEEPKPAPTTFRELLESLPFPAPIFDPMASWGAFRETFLCSVLDAEDCIAFRAFGVAQRGVASESTMAWRRGGCSFSEARALELGSVLADLRNLQSFLETVSEIEHPVTEEEGDPEWDRETRWRRYQQRLSGKIASLAEEIEKELEDGLQVKDE